VGDGSYGRIRGTAMYKNFNDLTGNIKDTQSKLVVAAAHDLHTLEAVYNAAKEHGTQYLLVGNREKIVSISADIGVSPGAYTIVDGGDDADCARIAVDLIRTGCGNALMKGILDTGTLLKAVLNKEAGVRGSGTLSHLAII